MRSHYNHPRVIAGVHFSNALADRMPLPTPIIAAFVILFGLAMGSFLNVCITRLPLRQSVVAPRSRCPQCGHGISAADNIPVLSWIRLRGRCRHCSASIPWRYPAVEMAMAALFLLCFLLFGLTLDAAGAAVFCFFMLALCVTDAETLKLPNALTLPALALGIAWRMIYATIDAPQPWRAAAAMGERAAISAAAAALGLLVIRSIYFTVRRRIGLGLGDVKLAAAIAAWLGIRQFLLVFFLAVVVGAVVGLVFIRPRHKQQEEPARVPLGCFLCLAAIYTAFLGRITLGWYLHLFP
jgi:leader peptidase (prepilin peptidase) / N-methyltransferase